MSIFRRRKAGQGEQAAQPSTEQSPDHTASTNVALEQLAALFVGEEIICELPHGTMASQDQFDYSLESLALVDDYLESIWTTSLTDADGLKVSLRAGAYVGQVLRQQVPQLDWVSGAELQAMGQESFGQPAALYGPTLGTWFPIAKVSKYLANGSEDSTAFFVRAAASQIRSTQ